MQENKRTHLCFIEFDLYTTKNLLSGYGHRFNYINVLFLLVFKHYVYYLTRNTGPFSGHTDSRKYKLFINFDAVSFRRYSVAIGICTYSGKVMKTVGTGIVKLSPISAFITVLASSLVLFFFSDKSLNIFLTTRNLPAFPLVPVSQSQAVVGAILGIGIAKGNRNVNYKQLLRIAIGWVVTPVMSSIISYIGLAIMQNVFMLEVFVK